MSVLFCFEFFNYFGILTFSKRLYKNPFPRYSIKQTLKNTTSKTKQKEGYRLVKKYVDLSD
jgi:hypothetical protein